MKIIPFQNWNIKLKDINHLFIAGPCSAETKEQVLETAKKISEISKVKVFRAGIWKPRTRPDAFEGVGDKALEWLKEVKQQTELLTCVEVATPKHVEYCLKAENAVDILWIGARTVSNPFSVQALADCLKGVDIPVMVKNPLIPDLKLWIGAIERLYNNNVKKLLAIHRGFYPFEETRYRNVPKWELLINLKTLLPNLQIIGDPSHIAGKADLVEEVAALFSCLNADGLMIETHINPLVALSDAKQQLTPKKLADLLSKINFEHKKIDEINSKSQMNYLRMGVDSIDSQIFELFAQRFKLVEKIGEIKIENNISIFQLERWREIVKNRLKISNELNINPNFSKKIIQLVHKESIELQSKLKKNN